MLEKEYEYFKKNKDDIVKQYLGKVIVIVGEKIIATYDNIETAISKTSEQYPLGSFLAKEIKENEPPIIFRSRVRYAE